MGFWPPIRGDGNNQIERVTLTGLTASNTDRGRLYGRRLGASSASYVAFYSDIDYATAVAASTPADLSAGSWTKVTIAEVSSSGVSGSAYIRATATSPINFEVYPFLATDTELAAERIDVTRYPKTGGTPTTFAIQHAKTREDFVRLMQSRIPPVFTSREGGTRVGSTNGPWRVNSVGDFELVRLQNVESYRQWAIHHTLEMIFRTVNRLLPDADTQLRVIEDEKALAAEAWAGTLPLIDDDADLDADREVKRFRIGRG